MPEWSTTAPEQNETFAWRLVRTPARGPLELTILSHSILGTYTHYHKGRTKPCGGDLCEACQLGIPKRWHCYLAVKAFRSGECHLLELTAQATQQLKPALSEFNTLRAVKIILERPSHRPNGRLSVRIVPGRAAELGLPPEPDIQRLMLHIWGLDDEPLTAPPEPVPEIAVTPQRRSAIERELARHEPNGNGSS